MPMLQAALLCDSAQDYAGKISILGGFVSVWNTAGFPVIAPVTFVGRVTIRDNELTQPHEFEISVESPSGQTIFATRGTVIPPEAIVNEIPELYMGLNVVLQLPLTLFEEGMHKVLFKADGDLMSSLPLLARLSAPSS